MLLADGSAERGRADSSRRRRPRACSRGRGASDPDPEAGTGPLAPLALVVIDQLLRPDAADTVAYFIDQGVAMKVISGDNPLTVGAIAAQAGIPGGDDPFDARELPTDIEALADVLETHSVFGRVTPAQKRAMVGALQSRGHVVAMTGDGVNDVLALKDADLGIAMGSGAAATRAVAQIVLLDNAFSVMPSVVAEGRRVLGNIERVSDLFLTKSFYAAILSFFTVFVTLTGIYDVEFLFLPRHLTVITWFTIGTPAFFLALMPNTQRFRPGFFRRVLAFAVPAGVVISIMAFASYLVTLAAGNTVEAGRVSATLTTFLIAWTVLFLVARPMNLLRWLIVASMGVGFLLVLVIPPFARFFAMELHWDTRGGTALLFGVIGSVVLVVVRRYVESHHGGSHA
jgi:cation-transporting ATPase E